MIAAALLLAAPSQPIPLKLTLGLSWNADVTETWTSQKDSSDIEVWGYRDSFRVVIHSPEGWKVHVSRKTVLNKLDGKELPLPKESSPIEWDEYWPDALGRTTRPKAPEDPAELIHALLTTFAWPDQAIAWNGNVATVKAAGAVSGSFRITVDASTGLPTEADGDWKGVPLPNGDGSLYNLKLAWKRLKKS